MPEDMENRAKEKCWTFAVRGWPSPPFITRKRKQRAAEFFHTMNEIQGKRGVLQVGPRDLLVAMDSENDAIIAMNRLRYMGFEVSDNIIEGEAFLPPREEEA